MLLADDMRLGDFVAELARYRHGYIRCAPEVANLRIVGVFPLTDTDRVLASLSNHADPRSKGSRRSGSLFRVSVEVFAQAVRQLLTSFSGERSDPRIILGRSRPCSMVESIGHPVRLALTGPDPLKPDLFSHIYLEVFHKGRWIPLDATMPYPMGWAPRTLVKKIIAIERRPNMMAEDMELQGFGAAAAVPDWLRGLIRAVRGEVIQPKDARVKSLWNLLRQRLAYRARLAWKYPGVGECGGTRGHR